MASVLVENGVRFLPRNVRTSRLTCLLEMHSVAPFLSCQCRQLRGRLIGAHVAPAWVCSASNCISVAAVLPLSTFFWSLFGSISVIAWRCFCASSGCSDGEAGSLLTGKMTAMSWHQECSWADMLSRAAERRSSDQMQECLLADTETPLPGCEKCREEDNPLLVVWGFDREIIHDTAAPACRTRPRRRGHIPVVPLTLLWACPSPIEVAH